MTINGYKDIHVHPSPYTFNPLHRGLQNDYPGVAVVNSIVTLIFPSNLPEFKEDVRLFLVLKILHSLHLIAKCVKDIDLMIQL